MTDENENRLKELEKKLAEAQTRLNKAKSHQKDETKKSSNGQDEFQKEFITNLKSIELFIQKLQSLTFSKIFLRYVIIWALGALFHVFFQGINVKLSQLVGALIGGLATGVLIKYVLPKFELKYILSIALSWALSLSFVVSFAYYPLYYLFGGIQSEFSIRAIEKALAVSPYFGPLIAGMLTGFIIKKALPHFKRKNIAIVGLGWTLGLIIGKKIGYMIQLGGTYYPIAIIVGWPIMGAIGITITYWQINELKKIKDLFHFLNR